MMKFTFLGVLFVFTCNADKTRNCLIVICPILLGVHFAIRKSRATSDQILADWLTPKLMMKSVNKNLHSHWPQD